MCGNIIKCYSLQVVYYSDYTAWIFNDILHLFLNSQFQVKNQLEEEGDFPLEWSRQDLYHQNLGNFLQSKEFHSYLKIHQSFLPFASALSCLRFNASSMTSCRLRSRSSAALLSLIRKAHVAINGFLMAHSSLFTQISSLHFMI